MGTEMRVPVALAGLGVEPGATLRPTMLSGPGTLPVKRGRGTPRVWRVQLAGEQPCCDP